jgi:phosphoglycerol transferase MdoB-like AlkP superfamily enzyme
MSITFIALLLTIAFSFLPERFLKPQAPALHRNTVVLQSLLVSIMFICVSLVVQRAIFSALAVSIFLIILTAVSNAKFKALREPMIFSDIVMFSQAFKHPRLYFPFLGLAPVIIAPIIIIGLIISVLTLEPPLAFTWQRIISSLLAIIVFYLIARAISLVIKLSMNPDRDNAKHGLLNTLFIYSKQASTKAHKNKVQYALKNSTFNSQINTPKSDKAPPPFFNNCTTEERPNITIIQSESFFDARRLHPAIHTSVLKNFDNCNAESIQYGKLKIPAWGANTMRSEFAFLSGLQSESLGFYRFYPYHYLHKMKTATIASLLQNQGYYCICIHPHSASFFGRDRIFSAMGFDEFIDIKSFKEKDCFGPYISDQAVTEKILEITKNKTDKPLFIFAITMENHGPLHLEKVTKEEQEYYYSHSKSITENNDLTVYLRHLANADKMIESLTEYYKRADKDTLLCLYGDHVPSMPAIYTELDYHDAHSDYFIWQNKGNIKTINKKILIENLACTLLEKVN